MPDAIPRYFSFDDDDNDVLDDFLEFENEDEQEEEQEDDPIVDPFYFCVRE